jgi:hypothetical protein
MKKQLFSFICVLAFILSACVPNGTTNQIQVSVVHDGITDQISVPDSTTVSQAIAIAGIAINPLDRIEPDAKAIVSQGLSIKLVRVSETYAVEEVTLPFESQTIKNESLTAGQTILIQAGKNGLQSITYRVVSEDGIEVSKTVSKVDIMQASQPEIIMVGIQSSYRAIEINGLIAYISSSNAWLMESNTGNRRALVNSGDLDGRIFSISPDREWLLFSKSNTADNTDTINTLWIVRLSDPNAQPLPLSYQGQPVKNIVHYADWVPGKAQTIAYSTVEPRSTAPGWQANNDLQILKFDASGSVSEHKTIIETTPGGIYGWWGTIFSWSPDASEIAYSRPDSIGLVDSKSGTLNPLVEFTPYNTQGDWAWVPPIAWSENHTTIYTVLPSIAENGNAEFDLTALLISNGETINFKQNVGLFAYSSLSNAGTDGKYWVAFLSATIPDQSETSRYALMVMDRDGSNVKKLYPGEGVQGLDPQTVVWSPQSSEIHTVAFIAQGNLMFVDPTNGDINQITGDGSISRIDWK